MTSTSETVNRTLKVGSLFSGVGGFDQGFSAAGFETAWLCEWDKDARAVLRRHFPGAALYGDVRDVKGDQIEPVDVVIWGSPCQDLSVAGGRNGLAGAKSGLFHEGVRVIAEMRAATGGRYPALSVWENVPGALSSNQGRDFAAVLDAMAGIGALDICWRVLDSRHFGVAQRRRRLFVVSDFGGERAAPVLFEREGVRRYPATCRAAGEALAAASPGGADGAGGRGEVNAFKRRGGFGWSESEGVSPTLESEGGTHQGGPERIPLVAAAVTSKWAKGTGGPDTATRFCASSPAGPPVPSSAIAFDWQKGNDVSNPRPSTMNLTVDESPTLGATRTPAVFHENKSANVAAGDAARAQRAGASHSYQFVASETAASVTASAGHHGHSSPRGDGSDNQVVATVAFTSKDDGRDATDDIAPTLRAMSHRGEGVNPNGGGQIAVAVNNDSRAASTGSAAPQRGGGRAQQAIGFDSTFGNQSTAVSEISPPVKVGTGLDIASPPAAMTPAMQVRRLMPVETERLQAWPDGWTEWGMDEGGGRVPMSDSARYRQAGNGVTSTVAAFLAVGCREALL